MAAARMSGAGSRSFDAVVIGGGIAGLSLAARLAQSMRVAVLEAEEAPGYHASGRSVAFAHFGLGETFVRTLTAWSLPRFREMEGMSGTPVASGHAALHIASEAQASAFDALVAVHESFGCDFEILQGEEIQRVMPVLKTGSAHAARAILDHGSLHLDTDAMLQRHLADLRASGGALVTGAKVTCIAHKRDLWEVRTDKGAFQSPRLINAAGAWADEVARLAGAAPIGLEPRRRTVIGFDGPADTDVSRWPFTKTIADGFYMLPEGRGRLLASPMDQTPSAPCDAAPEELDKAVAADRIERATTLCVRRIVHGWAGLRSFARDELPVIGEAGDAPGFYWVAGQGGYGFQTSPALSRIAACAVTGAAFPGDLLDAGITPELVSPGRFNP
jgi:D-arginine dehydrogenase